MKAEYFCSHCQAWFTRHPWSYRAVCPLCRRVIAEG
jgi:DNA-directed RNA polymerase subunit RPC12/RpoP